MSTIGITTFYYKRTGQTALSCLERLDGFYYVSGDRYIIDEPGRSYTLLPPHAQNDTTYRIIRIALSYLFVVGLIAHAIVLVRRCYCYSQLSSLVQSMPSPTRQIPPPTQPPLAQPITANEQRFEIELVKQILEIQEQSKKEYQLHQDQLKKAQEEIRKRALNFEGSAPLIGSKELSSATRLSFLASFKQYNKAKHTLKFQDKEFALLTPFTTNFNQPLAFIGELTQPICFLDPDNSPQLLALAERLKDELIAKGEETGDLAKLEYIKEFVATKAFPKPQVLAPIPKKIGSVPGIDHCIFHSKQKLVQPVQVPLISMESYLEYPGNENSLHKALLLAFLLSFLVKNRLLPEGVPLIMFDNIQNDKGTHTHFWNQFLISSRNERWHIDTHAFIHEGDFFTVPVCDLNLHSTQRLLKDHYSPKSIDEQMQAADSVLEYLQNNSSGSLPAYVELCSRAGGAFISKTSSGVEGLNSGARYHAVWQLILNNNLKFAFYKSSDPQEHSYSCLTYVQNRFLSKTFQCQDPTTWNSAIDGVCALRELDENAPFPTDWKNLEGSALIFLSYSYFNGRPQKLKEPLEYEDLTDAEIVETYATKSTSAIVISTAEPFYTILYKQDKGYVHKRLPKAEIEYNKTRQPNWALLIKEIATITGTPYTDTASVYRRVKKSKRQDTPERLITTAFPQFYKESLNRKWSECYESDRGCTHEWPGIAKIFTLANSDFQTKGSNERLKLPINLEKCCSIDIFSSFINYFHEKPSPKNLTQHEMSFCLAFKNINDLAVQAFLRHMDEEYGLASLSYYHHCLREGEALSLLSPRAYEDHCSNRTGSGKARISAYLHPFVHIKEKEIQTSHVLLSRQEKPLAGFTFPKSLEAIVYKEVVAFFENSHQAVLETDCRLPKVTTDIVSEYIGVEGITTAELTFEEGEDPAVIDEAFLKMGIKEMISMGRIKVMPENRVTRIP